MSGRIVYIDALRGLAMLMVVMVHIEGFSLFIEEFHISLFRRFCEAIMLPLFFFISGFVINRLSFKGLVINFFRLLIPALLLGIIYSMYIQKDIMSFFCNIYKYGYWFTITLFEMFIILYGAIKVSKNRVNEIKSLVVIAYILYILKIPFNNNPTLIKIGDIFCLHQLFLYFQYFAIGYILTHIRELYNRLINSELIVSLSIIIFGCALYVKCIYTDEQLAVSIPLKIYRALQDPILGYTGIIIFLRYFHSIEEFLLKSVSGKLLCIIGRHTLEIYLLHYFFLPKLAFVGTFLNKYPNIVLELLICLFISTIVICLSLLLGWLIRTNDILGFVFLGSKPKFLSLKKG